MDAAARHVNQKPRQHLPPKSCLDHQTTRMVCPHALDVAAPFRHLISFESHHLVARRPKLHKARLSQYEYNYNPQVMKHHQMITQD